MNDGQDEAQEAMPEPAQEERVLGEGNMLRPGAGAGVARAETAGPVPAAGPGEVRQRRGEGRRVTLGRQRGGGYSIWMGSRHIQSFCAEWEDVTRFQLPEGIEQQVRINIEVMGEARMLRPEYSGEQPVMVDAEDPPLRDRQLRRAVQQHEARLENASPSMQNIPRQRLVEMFTELPPHNQEIIAGQIEANHREVHGVALHSTAHPNEFQSLLGDLRESVRHTLEILERLG